MEINNLINSLNEYRMKLGEEAMKCFVEGKEYEMDKIIKNRHYASLLSFLLEDIEDGCESSQLSSAKEGYMTGYLRAIEGADADRANGESQMVELYVFAEAFLKFLKENPNNL